MHTLILPLLLQGVFALWFHHRFKIAEERRLRCQHDLEANEFTNTARLVRQELDKLWNRHQALARELKSIEGTMHNSFHWIRHFLDKHDPPKPMQLLEPNDLARKQ